MNKARVVIALAALAAICGTLNAAPKSQVRDIGSDLAKIRQATAKYHRLEVALADGYIDMPVAGNPGGVDALLVNFAAGYDGPPQDGGIPGVLKLEEPEGLGYVKLPNGELRLASVFFFKPYAPFGYAVPSEPAPLWLGHYPEANLNIGAWEMEVWIWVDNPDGMFEFYNPRFLEDWDTK